eukprot:665862-Pelagomonas_calceolata.AAC.1
MLLHCAPLPTAFLASPLLQDRSPRFQLPHPQWHSCCSSPPSWGHTWATAAAAAAAAADGCGYGEIPAAAADGCGYGEIPAAAVGP